MIATPEDVLAFWFGAPAADADELITKLKRWFRGGPGMDEEIARRFGATVEAALAGELDTWRETPRGRLALVLVLDQLTRHCFRGDARSWAGDAKAQALAAEAIERGLDAGLAYPERIFLAMPLHHAEDLELQRQSLAYARKLAASLPPGLASVGAIHVGQCEKYNDVIARFGRFPHRNAALGRRSSAAELEFLEGWACYAPPAVMRDSAPGQNTSANT